MKRFLDHKTCSYCEANFSDSGALQRSRDHFIPLSKGGKNGVGNIYIVCKACNLLKANFLPNEFIYFLRCKIEWKEYPKKLRRAYTEEILLTVKKNVKRLYERGFNKLAEKKVKSNSTSSKKNNQKNDTPHYINYNGKDCSCVGYINRSIGTNVKKGQNAYYYSDSTDEKYVFSLNGFVVAYFKATIQEYIIPFTEELVISNSSVDDYKERWKVETITDKGWIIEDRLYYKSKSFEDFDLRPLINKRKATRIEFSKTLNDIVERMLKTPSINFNY